MDIAYDAVDCLFDAFKKELDIQRLLTKMPEYNVEYSIQLAYQVNDVAIKSYDIKKDDGLIFEKDLFEEDNQEPQGPGKDPFKIDKVSEKVRFNKSFIYWFKANIKNFFHYIVL